MEIISIYTRNKDDSILDFYDLDHRTFEVFVTWAIGNQNSTGVVKLDRSSYDQAVELLGTDDLHCPLSLVIEYSIDGALFSLSIPFDRGCGQAYLSTNAKQ